MKYKFKAMVDLGDGCSREYVIITHAGNYPAAVDQVETLINNNLDIENMITLED